MSGRVLNAGNGVRERFPILTQARECQFVLFNPFAWVYPTATILGEEKMIKEYNFSTAKRNPYVKRLKKAVTIRLEPDVINYFKALSTDTGIPYQNLINLYLLDCAKEQRRLALTWKK